jgi:hypothetical protein
LETIETIDPRRTRKSKCPTSPPPSESAFGKPKKETAKNLLLLKILTEEQIADVTGLDQEVIRHLKESMSSGAEDDG